MRRNALKTTPAKTAIIGVSLPPAVLAQVDRICATRKLSRGAVLALIIENSPHLRLARSSIFRVPRAASTRIQALLERDTARVWRVAELVAALKLPSAHVRVALASLVRRGAATRVGRGQYAAAAGDP